MWPSGLFLVHQPLLGQRLAGGEFQLFACLAADGNLWESAQVLPHVEDDGAAHQSAGGRGDILQGVLDADALHHLYRVGYLRHQPALGAFLQHHGFPAAGPRFLCVGCGTVGFQPCVVVFAAIDAVVGDGTFRPLPVLVAEQPFAGVVGICDVEEEQQGGRPERNLQLVVAPALLIVKAVAQQHTELVVAGCQLLGDVVGVEEYRLVVVAPVGGKLRMAYLPAVQRQLVETESADAQLGMLYGLEGLERPAQHDAAARQRVGLRPQLACLLQHAALIGAPFGQPCVLAGDGPNPAGPAHVVLCGGRQQMSRQCQYE